MERLPCDIGSLVLVEKGVDQVRWSVTKEGIFFVNPMFKTILSSPHEPFHIGLARGVEILCAAKK